MENMLNTEEIEISRELLERTNPVYNTAKMTLYQLSAAGDENAKAIAEKLGLTFEGTQSSATVKTPQDELALHTLVLETRYRTMGKLAEDSGYPVEVDMPCGYTPRAIEFAEKDKPFVGLDLPAAIAEAEPVIRSLISEEKQSLVRFAGVDATNYQSLKAVFDEIDGPVCITTEGLLMYFTESETGMLCDNIKKILDRHGGCWITPDPETSIQFILFTKAFYGDRFMEIMMQSKQRVEDKSDVNVGQNTMTVVPFGNTAESMQKAMMFLAAHGLRAERMIVADHVPALKSMEWLGPEQTEAVKAALKQIAYWKITSSGAETLNTAEAESENFKAEASISGGQLSLKLSGRLDTLTAPNLLAFFEKTAETHSIEKVTVDCSQLDYTSSAGLRVLLIMQKKCEKGVALTGINETVRDILQQTGFDSIFDLKD